MDLASTNAVKKRPSTASANRRQRMTKRHRRGSLIIEAAVASVLLATAIVAVTRMASASAKLRIKAQIQLATELESQNVLEQLRNVPTDQLEAKIQRIETDLQADGYDVADISAEPDDENQITHLVVRLEAGDVSAISQNWRVNKTDEPSETDQEGS